MPPETAAPPVNFSVRIEEAIKDLMYLSETDAPFEAVDAASFERVSFNEFFAPLITVYEGANEATRTEAAKFAGLKSLLESRLTNLTVFKFGAINKEIYIIGLDEDKRWRGVKTRAVET